MSKVGIYDSGLGGLHVYEKLKQNLPQVPFVYFGDNAYMPLSNHSTEEIQKRVEDVVQYLFEKQDCSLVLLACNTASVVAVRHIQQEWMPQHNVIGKNVLGINIVAMEYMNEEFSQLKSKRGLVLMTPTTEKNNVYQERLKGEGFEQVVGLGLSDLAAAIESQDEERIKKAIATPMEESHIDPQSIDYVLFACTHYPIVQEAFKSFFNSNTIFIDPSDAIGSKLSQYLSQHAEFRFEPDNDLFLMSKDDSQFASIAQKLFQKDWKFSHAEL